MAAPNGDKGRDAEVFTIDGVPKVAFQYSVTASWKTKITSTLDTLKKNLPSVSTMIYLTNQVIGRLPMNSGKSLGVTVISP